MVFIAFLAYIDVMALKAWMAIIALINVMAEMTRTFDDAEVAYTENTLTELPHMAEIF